MAYVLTLIDFCNHFSYFFIFFQEKLLQKLEKYDPIDPVPTKEEEVKTASCQEVGPNYTA